MKRPFHFTILGLSLLSQSSLAANLAGTYESKEAIDCALTVHISSHGSEYAYRVKTTTRDTDGVLQYKAEENAITFTGLTADYPEDFSVNALYLDNAILIQNYGNAMNEYTFLSECDEKYLELQKGE